MTGRSGVDVASGRQLIAHPRQELPAGALMFPNPPAPGQDFSFLKLRNPRDPAVLLRSYAKRTRKADTSAAAVIGALSRGTLGV